MGRARTLVLCAALATPLFGCASILGLDEFGPASDASLDAATLDAATLDAATLDGGALDGGTLDGGEPDGGALDATIPATDGGTGIPRLDRTTLVAGANHTCWLQYGTDALYCWGGDGSGQLGDGAVMGSRSSPRNPVVGPSSGWRWIAGGGYVGCGVTAAGAAFCWGNNSNLQLGPAGVGDMLVDAPVEMTAIAAPSAIAVERAYMAAVAGSTLYLWGLNTDGQVRGTAADPAPLQEHPLGRIAIALDVGFDHGCVAREDGMVLCWGENDNGQLGRGSTGGSEDVGTATAIRNVTAIAAGNDFTCVVTLGAVRCFGENTFGTIGNGAVGGDVVAPHDPFSAGSPGAFVDVRAQQGTVCALTDAGELFCWGESDYGQVGDSGLVVCGGASRCAPRPVRMLEGQVVRDFAVGTAHVCALNAAGELWCWGSNDSGELGAGPSAPGGATPVRVLVGDLLPP